MAAETETSKIYCPVCGSDDIYTDPDNPCYALCGDCMTEFTPPGC